MKTTIAPICLLTSLLTLPVAAQTLYWGGTSANSWTDSNWGTSSGGPFDQPWVSGSPAEFDQADSTITGADTEFASITANENVTVTPGGTLGTGGTVATITVASGKTFDFGGQAISTTAGTGFIKAGDGTLIIENTGGGYDGGFTLNAGTVSIAGVNALGAGGALAINGGVLQSSATARNMSGKFGGGITIGGDFTFAGSGLLVFNDSTSLGGAVRSITNNATVSMTLGGIISGTSGNGLAFYGTGTTVLTNINTYDGKTAVYGGQVSINSDASLGAAPGSVVDDQLILDGGTLNNNVNGTILSANRGMTLGANGAIIKCAANTTILNCPNSIKGVGGLTVNLGIIDLKNTNTFSGGLTLTATNGGTIAVRFDSDSAGGTGPITVTPVARNITLRNTGVAITTLTNDITFNSSANVISLDSDAVNTFVMSGKFSGDGALTHGGNAAGGGTVVLSGDNSAWSGGLTQRRGNTVLGHKNALGTAPLTVTSITTSPQAVILSANTTLTGANAVTNAIVLALASPSVNWTIGGANDLELSGPVTLTVTSPIITNNNSGATIFSGNISGTGFGLTFTGTGTTTLAGDNTYDGGTTVSSGTLLVNNSSGSGTGTGAITVQSGATLGGSGTIGGPVTVNSGGRVGAGSSPGLLTFANGLDLSAGGINVWELAANSTASAGSDFDQIVLSGGNLTLGGSAALQVNFIGSVNFTDPFWQANHTWKIINCTLPGSNPGPTTFASLNGTNGITAGTFAVSADTTGVFLNFTTAFAGPSVLQPRITSIVGAGTASVIVNYTNSVAGTNYILQYNTNITNTAWINVTTNPAAGTTASQTNNPPPGTQQRYYRVYYVTP